MSAATIRPCLTRFVLPLALVSTAPFGSAWSQSLPSAAPTFPIFASGAFREMESKYIFGFTDGSDIGVQGEKSVELETTSSFGKRAGRYSTIEQELEFEHVATQNFGYELSAHGLRNSISNVPGLTDINQTAFSGLSAKGRYLILGRGPESSFGLTVSAEPEWARVDGGTGEWTRTFATKFKLAADTELIANRLYAATNLIYEPEVAQAPGDKNWERASTFGVTGALAWRLTPRIALGGEVEYYRAYDGVFLNSLAGRALYVGPTLQVQFTNKVMLAAAFSTQVSGHALGDARALDLENFTRHKFNLKFEVEF